MLAPVTQDGAHTAAFRHQVDFGYVTDGHGGSGEAQAPMTLVAFDPAFAAAAGWPVGWIDAALTALTASMVVAAVPTAGAVLVTAMVVIPPAAARQWTDRLPPMLAVAGLVGFVSSLAGVVASAVVPKLATGPAVVLA